MKKTILFHLIILLIACNQSNDNKAKNDVSKDKDLKPNTETESINEEEINSDTKKMHDDIDMKSLFSISPIAIFDETTEGLSPTEKYELLNKGESGAWKIIEENKTKLTIKHKDPSSKVTFYFFKNKNNKDGVLAAEIINEKAANIQSWNYLEEHNALQKTNILKKYDANDFVSKEDKLPDSYKPVLRYQFIDDQTIEVSLNTWMEKEFENREIINKIFLKWNGENFEEKIVKNKEGNTFNILNKPNYDLSKLNYDGKILNKRIWQDANGENITLFTRKGDELFVYHYTVNSDNVKLLGKVYEYEKECDYDLTLEFIEKSINVTDLDNNNIGEITFAYNKACISDVSPLGLKLFMLENGNKYIIRGTTSIDKPGIKIDGTKNVDRSFNNAPDGFLSHANKIWGSVNK